MNFCEHAGSGYIKQPANSISNLAFSIAGFFIAVRAHKTDFLTENRMTSTLYYPLLMSISLIILGAGSFAMHATNTAMGGFFDLFGMYMVSCFLSAYAIARWFNLSGLGFFLLFAVGVTIGSYIKLTPGHGKFLFLTAASLWFVINLLVAAIFEVMLHYVRKIEIQARLGWLGLLTLLLAFAIWSLSRNQDSLLCDPYLWLQGHAVWHVLNAVAACFLFLFYTSEVGQSAESDGAVSTIVNDKY